MLSDEFWRNKRVLITGHTGFKGAWLTLWLAEKGALVSGYALAPPAESLFASASLTGRMDLSRIGDIRDAAGISTTIHDVYPEVIIHLAAQPLVLHSYRQPIETYAVNVMGTAHVLEAARRVDSVRAIVVVTTDKCYRNSEAAGGYKEDDALGGSDPYSSSKACVELVTEAFRSSYFSDGNRAGLASARAGNVIGGGDWGRDRLLPDCARAIRSGAEVKVRNPEFVRPWQHVLDCLSGYLLLAERLFTEPSRYSSAYNFGPPSGEPRSVETMVAGFCQRLDPAARIVIAPSGEKETRFLTIDSSKAQNELGWRPRLSTDAGLDLTAEWYRSVFQGADPAEVCSRQLASYESLR